MFRREILVLVLFPALLLAGGADWQVRVKSVEAVSDREHRIVLEQIEPIPIFDEDCESVTVVVQQSRWAQLPENLVSRERYAEALDYLERSLRSEAIVRFGVMGTGLIRDGDDSKCHWRSRALTLIDGAAVYSFHKWP